MTDYNLKAIKQEFKEKGIYYTPKPIIDIMLSHIPKDLKYSSVYDPTCGHGDLLKAFPPHIAKYGQDINETAVKHAQTIQNSVIKCGDTLTAPPFPQKKFELILANPPFSIKWNRYRPYWYPHDLRVLPPPSKADYMFILHILSSLSSEGYAIIICSVGVLYRGGAEGKIREYLINNNYIDTVQIITKEKFVDTNIDTAIITLSKNRKHYRVTMMIDDISKVVTRQEITATNYNLTPSYYIDISPPKKVVDIKESTRHYLYLAVNTVAKELEVLQAIEDISGIPLKQEYIKRVKKLINDNST